MQKNDLTAADIAVLDKIQKTADARCQGHYIIRATLASIGPDTDRAHILKALLDYPGNTRQTYRAACAGTAQHSEFFQFLVQSGIVYRTNSLVRHGYYLSADGELAAKIVTRSTSYPRGATIAATAVKAAPGLKFEPAPEPKRTPESVIHLRGFKGTAMIPFDLDDERDRRGWAQAQEVILALHKAKKPMTKEDAVFEALGKHRFSSCGGRIFQGCGCWLLSRTYGKNWEELWTLSSTGEQFARCLSESMGRLAKEAMHPAK